MTVSTWFIFPRLGGRQTVHRREVVEAALAHPVRDQTEAAYARSDLFDRRRQLTRDWANLDSQRNRHVQSAAKDKPNIN